MNQEEITEWVFNNVYLPDRYVILVGMGEWAALIDEVKAEGHWYRVACSDEEVIRLAGYELRPAPFPCLGIFAMRKEQYEKLKELHRLPYSYMLP